MIKIINSKNIKNKAKAVMPCLIITAIFSGLFIYSKECKNGIVNGLIICVSNLVPSLFLYMILASYISGSKISLYIGAILGKPVTKLLKLPKSSASAILLSLIGGYPVGAKCVANAYKNNLLTKSQAKKLSLITVSSGTGFTLNFVALSLYNNKKIGIILLVSQILAYIITATLICVFVKCDDSIEVSNNRQIKHTDFTSAVFDGCVATLNMCAMVIVFSALVCVCEKILHNTPHIKDIIILTLEVTTACTKLYTKYPIYAISFAMGFSGLCIHFQIFSILKDIGINKMLFFFFRIIQGICSACLTYILLIFFPVTVDVFSSVDITTPEFSSTVTGGMALILTSVCFLNSINISNLKRR